MSEQDKNQVQPHEEDDCEDCQKERAQNNQLINIYERLHKIKTKVSTIKPNIQSYASACKDNQTKLTNINFRIKNPPNLDLSKVNEKQMGYELAYALIQRQMKMKRQNQILTKRIEEIKQVKEIQEKRSSIKIDKEVKEQTIKQKPKSQSQRYSDSLDEIKESKSGFWLSPAPKNNSKLSNYSNSFSVVGENTSTNSSFENQEKKKYPDLNLWLYQLNMEAQEKALYQTGVEKKKKSKKT